MYDSAAHLKKPTISNVFIRKKLVGSQILYVALKISPRIWKKNRPCLMSLLEKKNVGSQILWKKFVLVTNLVFFLDGVLNRHNCRYWAPDNPRVPREAHSQYPQKLNVWAGIFGDTIIGPFFIEFFYC